MSSKDKQPILREILAALIDRGIGSGESDDYKPGDNFMVLWRKILQKLEN